MIRKLQEIGRLAAQEFRNIPDGRKDGPGLAFAAVMQFPEKLLLGIAYGIGTRIEFVSYTHLANDEVHRF